MKKTLLISATVFLCLVSTAQQKMSLAGEWRFALDEKRTLTPTSQLPNKITLPGTTDEAGYGTEPTKSDFGILTRRHKYYGQAWYSRTIEVPKSWAGKQICLRAERVMWQSCLYVDGVKVGVQDALNSPHIFTIGILTPGIHELRLSIDNSQIYNIGDKGHVYTEYTQSIWNGAVGDIELYVKPDVAFGNPQIYTRNDPRMITVKDTISVRSGKVGKAKINYTLTDYKTGENVWSQTAEQIGNVVNFTATLPSTIKLWDDVTPNLYTLTMTLTEAKGTVLDTKSEQIGFREIESRGNRLFINGRPLFLRGNLDCVHFPLTGYPSCDVKEWERIFSIYKDYGLNHVRFHSWTPPAAAFIAADRLGLYLQSEVLWLDWWMAVDQPDRPEMYTNGLPDGLGKNPSADKFAQAEMRRMVNTYGNHASFAMMCIGNELGNSDFDVMESWIKPYRQSDNRRLYASSSARKINPSDQYAATHYIQGLGSTRGLQGGASLNWDFEKVYEKASVPVIAHEIGQWPVYPRWSEIKKYTGVLRAMNFEEFAASAPKAVYDMNESFVKASGALNQLMYKYEIESFLRTPSCSGIQLLSMQDYQGQGEALIGWLDVFYESKGITTPEKFRRHHDSTVVLLRLPKFVYKNSENLEADIQLAHWGVAPLTETIKWKIADEQQRPLSTGTVAERTFACGTSEIAGKLHMSLSGITKATKLTITASLVERNIENSWEVWVYPPVENQVCQGVNVTKRFDAETIALLENGGSVVLDASELGTEQSADAINFYPLYWSLTFFPGQGKNTIGLVVDDKHPALSGFPTENHSNWQWQTIYNGAKGFYINDFPSDYRPIVQPVDDFHRNNFVASIFELKVGKGRLLVCGFNISDTTNTVAMHLRRSLAKYAASSDFDPQYSVCADSLSKMFRYVEPLRAEVPAEFESAILYVEAAANQKKDGDDKWSEAIDKISVADKCSYKVTADGTWRDDMGTAWHGRNIELRIECPKGFIGSLYLYFHDWNKQGREAILDFEGRDFKLEKHPNGQWVRLHVMREDSNKGFITLRVKTTKGGNTMLSKAVLIPE